MARQSFRARHDDRYEPVIGLEIHAQLLTASKIFCGCSTAFGAPPNTHVCPVCLGFPGRAAGAEPARRRSWPPRRARARLPRSTRRRSSRARTTSTRICRRAIRSRSTSSRWPATARSNSGSPDGPRRIGITRVHLEEDAGKSLHEGFADSDRKTYVDYNRSGTPLIEIVTEPDLRSAADAAEFFSRLRSILVWLGVNDGNMEEGSLRCDANVSVRPVGAPTLGTKAEVKNLNSFRFLQKALEFEIDRQIDAPRRRRPRRAGDAALGLGSRRDRVDAQQGRGARLPLLPRARSAAARRRRRHASPRSRATMPELPDAPAAAVRRGVRLARLRRVAVDAVAGASPTTSRPPSRPAPPRRRRATG